MVRTRCWVDQQVRSIPWSEFSHSFRWKRVSIMLKFSRLSGPDEGSLEIDGWYWSPQIKLCRLIVVIFWVWIFGVSRDYIGKMNRSTVLSAWRNMRVMQHKKTIKKSKWRRRPHVRSAFSTVNWFPRCHLWYTHVINNPRGIHLAQNQIPIVWLACEIRKISWKSKKWNNKYDRHM